MDENVRVVRDAYNQIADKYVSVLSDTEVQFLDLFFNNIKGSKIIDLGCGQGRVTKYCHDHRGLSVLGCDVSEKMIERAKTNNNAPNDVTYEIVDMQEITCGTDYDAAIASFSFIHLTSEQVLNTLMNLRKIMKSNGVIYISLLEGDDLGYIGDPIDKNVKIFVKQYLQDEITALLNRSGFKIVDIGRGEDTDTCAFSKKTLFILAKKIDLLDGLKESYTNAINKIGKKFESLCRKQEQAFFNSDKNIVSGEDIYQIIKELFEQDKNIRIRDSYSIDHVEKCLKDLLKRSRGFSIENKRKEYLDRFVLHLEFNLDLIQLLRSLDTISKDIITVNDKILFLLNYCIITERTSYFQGLFINKLDELNSEITGISSLNYNLFFRVGALNFKRHLYDKAIICLTQAISIMESTHNISKKKDDFAAETIFRSTLFKAKMLCAVSHEFQGDFNNATNLLIGSTPESLLSNISLDKLIYTLGNASPRNDTSASLEVLITKEQENVIDNVQTDIVNTLKSNIIAGTCMEYAVNFDNWLNGLSEDQKREIRFLNSGNETAYFDNEKSSLSEKYDFFQNEHVHEVLHILAHTVNEYAVNVRNCELLNNEQETSSGPLLVISRALMLFVAKNQNFMVDCQKCLTCLATIYAEVGDYVSARAQLLENVSSNYYKYKNKLIQAEIEFFYYLISLMDNPNAEDQLREDFFKKYLNCCYFNFDYDALTQIEMYRFKYAVATSILNRKEVKTSSKIALELRKCLDDFQNFSASLQSIFVSDWTKNEHDKINIMFQFLIKYYNISNAIKNLSIYDLAMKYLYLYAKSIKFRDTTLMTSFNEEEPKVIQFLDQVFRQPISELYKKDKPIHIRNCIFRNISNMEGNTTDEYLQFATNDLDNIYFIVTSKKDLREKNHYHIWIGSDEEEALQNFLIHCAFDCILYDFANPQNIFILVPFVGAEPLKYQLDSFNDLLFDADALTNMNFNNLKETQRNRLVGKFDKNYSQDYRVEWVNNIFEEFSEVEMILWNDEEFDTVYSKERFYIANRSDGDTKCYPLMNHTQFVVELKDIVNKGNVEIIHDSCPMTECCQNSSEPAEQVAKSLSMFFCISAFCSKSLRRKKIIVKYNSRKKNWGIVIARASIGDSKMNLLQAFLCENKRYIFNRSNKKTKKPVGSNEGNKIHIEAIKEDEIISCMDVLEVAKNWVQKRIEPLDSSDERDREIIIIYEDSKEKLNKEFNKTKRALNSANDVEIVKELVCGFKSSITIIKNEAEEQIKQKNEGEKP